MMTEQKKYEIECRTPMKMSSAELKEIGGYWIFLQNEFPENWEHDGVLWGGWRWIAPE